MKETRICSYINPTLAPSAQITGYVAGNVITPTITVPDVSNPAITAGYGQFINLSINGTAGKTLTSSYGLLIGAGSLSTASVTNSYGGYFSNPAFGSGVKMALYADNMSVGYNTTPLTNGMWIAGSVGIGTNGDIGSRFVCASSGSLSYNAIFNGTQTGQTSNRQIGLGILPTLAPSAQITGNVTAVSIEPTITVPNVTNPAIAKAYGEYINLTVNGTAGKTLTNLYGLFTDVGSLSTASVTNVYGGYFSAPTMGGTVNQALYADNLSIGISGSTPSANGFQISGVITSTNTTDSTSASTGAFFTSGGIGIGKSLFCTGNGTFSFANATAGSLLVQNSNNSSGSSANVTVKVGGGSADDPTIAFNVQGVTTWTYGIDNDNATTGLVDAFTLSVGTSFGTNDALIISKGLNFGFWGYSDGGGAKTIFLANRGTAPSSNPTGGGILYAEGGALKWRGSGGTTTTIAVA